MVGFVQRVTLCKVIVDNDLISSIGHGMLVLLGVHKEDTEKDIMLLARKCAGLRIFPDSEGKMNLSIKDTDGEMLVVSQFTLLGDVSGGLRPFFGDAAEPAKANDYYERFIYESGRYGIPVKGGEFGAHMHVELVNDGPVTIIIDTRDI